MATVDPTRHLDDPEEETVERLTTALRRDLRDRLARADGERAEVTLGELATAVDGDRSLVETAMVLLVHDGAQSASASVERVRGVEDVRWAVEREA